MTAKEYLMQVRNTDNLINAKLREFEELRKQIESLQSVQFGEKVKSSQTGDSMQKTIEKIIDMQNEINAEVDKLVDLKSKIRAEINQLLDNRYITVLTDYFINCMTFDEIANEEKYSRRQISRLYGNALQSFQKDVLKCP